MSKIGCTESDFQTGYGVTCYSRLVSTGTDDLFCRTNNSETDDDDYECWFPPSDDGTEETLPADNKAARKEDKTEDDNFGDFDFKVIDIFALTIDDKTEVDDDSNQSDFRMGDGVTCYSRFACPVTNSIVFHTNNSGTDDVDDITQDPEYDWVADAFPELAMEQNAIGSQSVSQNQAPKPPNENNEVEDDDSSDSDSYPNKKMKTARQEIT